MIKESQKFADSNTFEGMVSLRALIYARENNISDRTIKTVLYDAAKKDVKTREIAYLRHKADELGFELKLTGADEIDSLTVGSTHGGVVAVCGDRTIDGLAPEHIKDGGFYVMIEGIEDPYNFGYALRSLYAAGADGVVLTPRNWMGAAGVVCRASAGASEYFDMHTCEPAEAARIFKSHGYKIVCADIENSVSAYDADLRYPVFMIVGGEKRGISRALLDTADAVVRLDYGRDFSAALSAASAASILAFEAFRQNRKK